MMKVTSIIEKMTYPTRNSASWKADSNARVDMPTPQHMSTTRAPVLFTNVWSSRAILVCMKGKATRHSQWDTDMNSWYNMYICLCIIVSVYLHSYERPRHHRLSRQWAMDKSDMIRYAFTIRRTPIISNTQKFFFLLPWWQVVPWQHGQHPQVQCYQTCECQDVPSIPI